MIFGLRTFEQVEFHKPRHRVEVAITRQPYVFESLLRPFDDTESVHGDKHRGDLLVSGRMTDQRDWVAVGPCMATSQ